MALLKSFGRSIEIWCDFLNVAILVFLAFWRAGRSLTPRALVQSSKQATQARLYLLFIHSLEGNLECTWRISSHRPIDEPRNAEGHKSMRARQMKWREWSVEAPTNAKPVWINIFQRPRPNHNLTFHSPLSTNYILSNFTLQDLSRSFTEISRQFSRYLPESQVLYNAKSKFIAGLIGELSAELAQFHSGDSDRIRPKNILKASNAERPRAPNRI
jgi:hypothetical protein